MAGTPPDGLSVGELAARSGLAVSALDRLPHDAVPSPADWQQLSQRWRVDLDERIEQLTRLRDDLGGCIGCGCLSLDRCSLFNPDDHLGRRGPGAHTLDTHLRGAEGPGDRAAAPRPTPGPARSGS